MADNKSLKDGAGSDFDFAMDDISSVFYPRHKLSLGADGSAADAVGGTGVDSTGVLRVSLATNVPLPAGTNGIGKLTANSGVDIGDVDILSIAAGDNNIGNVDLASAIPAGTAHIGQVKTPIQYVTVTMTTPTGALAAGDVYADTQIVAACTQANDVCAVLQSATIIDVDDQKAALTLVFFSANTSLGTEDSAPDIDDTEILTIQGHVVVAATDYVDYGANSVAFKGNLGIPVKPASGTDDIYMAIYGHSTSTPTYAGGAITVRLGFI